MEICTSYRTSVTQVSYSRLIFNTDIESSGSTVINSGNLQSGFWSSINLNTLVGVNPSPMIGLNAINASSTAVDIEWDLIHLNATGEPTFYWMSIGYWYIYIRICNTMCNAKAAIGSVLLVVFLQLTAPPATQEDFSIPQVQLATA
jgi:hypothetical protein